MISLARLIRVDTFASSDVPAFVAGVDFADVGQLHRPADVFEIKRKAYSKIIKKCSMNSRS